ncbi:MAG: hypothetical protein HY040_24390 [Planctomycetes bacterium]|nr:hypothetical protein [Planctomycetota bacterium]
MRPYRGIVVFVLVAAVALAASAGLQGQDAGLQRRINQAIDRGVAQLKRLQRPDGTWEHSLKRPDGSSDHKWSDGLTALIGWTLLECKVEPKDKQILKTADYVRAEALKADQTYSLSLMILFLDKLGDPADELLIQALGIRLLQGMSAYGGWSYTSGKPGPEEVKELEAAVKKVRDETPVTTDTGAPRSLHPWAAEKIKSLKQRKMQPPAELGAYGVGDNSNTQFALLALWVARRHGVPVHQHLTLVEERFRASALESGGWSYQPFSEQLFPQNKGFVSRATASMTCAGLLACAVGQGAKLEGKTTKELLEEPPVRDAFSLIGPTLRNQPRIEIGSGGLYYFLFSLERVAVIYELKNITDVDWYVAGAQMLLPRQQADGIWPQGTVASGLADTCFALIFLKKANVAWDILPILRVPVRMDPLRVDSKDLFDLPILLPKKENAAKNKSTKEKSGKDKIAPP